jgi:hypothetical protein
MQPKKIFYISFLLLVLFSVTSTALASLTISNTGIGGDSSFNNLTIPGISTSGCLTINSSGVISSTGTPCGSSSGTVTSVGLLGTANQITITGTSPITTSGSFTLSIPNNPTLPGTTTGTFSGNLTGTASLATSLAGGLGGQIPYQSAAGTTAMLANGTAGQVLTSAGTTLPPTWTTLGGGSGDMILSSIQTITGAKTFGTIGGAVGKLILAGSTSGSSILNAAAEAGSTTIVLPATSGTLMLNSDDTTGKSAKTDALSTTGASVNVSAGGPPTTGKVLTATDSTHATWQTPSGGSSSSGPCQLASSLGFALDGTDETTLLNSTFAAFQTAGGGCLAIDAGKTLRADGQIVLPNSGSPKWAVPTFRITGVGDGGDNLIWSGTPIYGGSQLDLRYASGPKIWSSGIGTFEIDHISITDGGSDCAAFLQTTGTKLFINHTTFYSSRAEGSGCNDAIILGGTGNYPITGAITDPFSGYGTVIESNTFARLARAVVFQGNVNDVKVLNNYVSGSGNTTTPVSAAFEAVTGGSTSNRSNTLRGNLIEGSAVIGGWYNGASGTKSYACGIKLTNSTNWVIDGNSFYDGYSGAAFLCGSSSATNNNVTKTNYLDTTGATFTDSNWSSNNYMPWRTVNFNFDGGGSALSGTTTRCSPVPFGGYINQFSMQADQTGNATVTVKTVAMGSYTGPGSASDISNGGETMSSASSKTDTTLTGWSRTIAPQTEVCVSLSSPSTVTWVSGSIQVWEGK